jgi:tetratricopeptide (TPR) repeat protein
VERLLEDLVMAGRLARTGGRWDLAIAWDDVVLREKPLALPSGALLAARAVAIFGAPMALDDLQAITGLADEPLFEALDVLARDQVLAADDEGRYWFTRREVAGRVGAEMPGDVRIGLHATVLARLEARLAGRALSEAPIELVTALATHALAVPEAAGAMGYCLAAARRALALFALADGTRFVEAGLPLAERAGDRAARLAFLQLAADLKRYAGEHEAALQALEAAVPLATELGEQRVLGALLATQALVCLSSSRHDQAQERARQAAEVCLAAADPAGAARALAADARASFFRGRVDEAKATGARALELAQQGESRNVLAQVLAYLGYLYVASEPDKLEEGIGYLRRAVALLEELGDRVRLNDAHILLGNAELTLGNFETARTSFETCLAIAREHGIGEDEVLALVNLATADLELGRAAEARKVAEEARTKGEALDIRLPLGMAIALEAAAAARLGKLADVDARFGEALALANQIGNKYLKPRSFPTSSRPSSTWAARPRPSPRASACAS